MIIFAVLNAEANLSVDAKRRALEQVLSSRAFSRPGQLRSLVKYLCEMEISGNGGVCQAFCVNGHSFIPGRLDGLERRVGLCEDATRAPTQGPGFRECERSSPPGPGIPALKR